MKLIVQEEANHNHGLFVATPAHYLNHGLLAISTHFGFFYFTVIFFVFDASPPDLFFPPFLFFFSLSSFSSSSEDSVSDSVVVSVDEDDVNGDLLLLFFDFRLLPCFFDFFAFFSFFFLFFSSLAKSLQSMFRSENASRTLLMLLVPVGEWDCCCNKSVSWLVCSWGWGLMAGFWVNEFNLVCLFVFVCLFLSVCLSLHVCLSVFMFVFSPR